MAEAFVRRVEELVAGELALFNNFNILACGEAAGAPDGWLLSRRVRRGGVDDRSDRAAATHRVHLDNLSRVANIGAAGLGERQQVLCRAVPLHFF